MKSDVISDSGEENAAWDEVEIDPALRSRAERAAAAAGLTVEEWLGRAITQACLDQPTTTAPPLFAAPWHDPRDLAMPSPAPEETSKTAALDPNEPPAGSPEVFPDKLIDLTLSSPPKAEANGRWALWQQGLLAGAALALALMAGVLSARYLLPAKALLAFRSAAETAAPLRPPATQPVASPASLPPASSGTEPSDPAQLAQWLETRANAGDVRAAFRLAVLLAFGKSVQQDYGKAAKFFRLAADANVADAQYDLGVLFSTGMGVPKDPAQAALWYRKAAAQGNAGAAFNLGVAYSTGTGAAHDMKTAAEWFHRAARGGVVNAQFNLALLYQRGEGVPASQIEAYAWYSVATVGGDAEAAQRRDHLASTMSARDLGDAKARAEGLEALIGSAEFSHDKPVDPR